MPSPGRKTKRGRYRKGSIFTPPAIAEAMEVALTLPVPTDKALIKTLGHQIRPGWTRAIIDIPLGLAWVAEKVRRARGVSRSRIYQEIVTFHLVTEPSATLDGVPAFLAGVQSEEMQEALIRAMSAAIRRTTSSTAMTIGEMAATPVPLVANGARAAQVRSAENAPRGKTPTMTPPPLPEEPVDDFDVTALR